MIASFAMVGSEDLVNMVEKAKDPVRVFPRTMLTGFGSRVWLRDPAAWR